ncbi:guanine nucleotide-binding protein G(o) subunit alpha-like [Oscarella lobularis]|uniref:guanine nucleotide-binding protein G(o) subunit alpha-like n=1 Tax=Oscarella lobularis TaxID=121494 RepID=UPI003313F196
MGSCMSLNPEAREAKLKSDEIDRELQRSRRERQNVLKILLLGAGESGKSTLVKQMKIIHGDGFTEQELIGYRVTICDNVLSSMKIVLNGMGTLRISLDVPSNKIHAETVLSSVEPLQIDGTIDPDVGVALQALWTDKNVRYTVSKGNEFQLNDSAPYFFDNIERIVSANFSPTVEDALRARVRTTGIIETNFRVGAITYRLFDVGGQRSERRKWIQCFDDVKAVLFVCALSGYDMTLYEDGTTNRLDESLTLFQAICNNRFFMKTSMVLFLNKVDLFRHKILKTDRQLRLYLPSFQGPDHDMDAAARFIQREFQAKNHNPNKTVFCHFTTATDTSNIQHVFSAVLDTIVRENLEIAHLI